MKLNAVYFDMILSCIYPDLQRIHHLLHLKRKCMETNLLEESEHSLFLLLGKPLAVFIKRSQSQ